MLTIATSCADRGLTNVAETATLAGMVEFKALLKWQAGEGLSDAQAAGELGWSTSKFSRVKNGLQSLKVRDQIKLEAVTGITPAQCAEFYADAVKARLADEPAPKKTGAAKKARRPFAASPEPEPAQ